MSRKLLAALVAALATFLLAVPALSAAPPPGARQAFIVVLDDSVPRASSAAADHAARFGAQVTAVWEHALKGYAATLDPGSLGALMSDRRVVSIERDLQVSIVTTQTPATWGLDRSDQVLRPLNNAYEYTDTGAGVTAYVIDTGILAGHAEFGGRASVGTDTVGDGRNGVDCNGHGTHVAGTIGGTTYGIAKGATIVAVRVLNCQGSGSYSGVISGINWVTAQHLSGTPAVANMSLGGSLSSALNTAVRNSINDGVFYAVAAGNSQQDACKSSPASTAEAVTVGATTSSDSLASYSNFGRCVDLNAPGSSITSAWSTSTTATNTISGTSMATPHVAGAAALYLQDIPGATPQAVRDALVAQGSAVVSMSSRAKRAGTTNRLLYTRFMLDPAS